MLINQIPLPIKLLRIQFRLIWLRNKSGSFFHDIKFHIRSQSQETNPPVRKENEDTNSLQRITRC